VTVVGDIALRLTLRYIEQSYPNLAWHRITSSKLQTQRSGLVYCSGKF